MARKLVVTLLIASVLSGCTHVHRIDPVVAGPDLVDLNRALHHRRAVVEVPHPTPHRLPMKLPAEHVRVTRDTAFLTLLLEPGEVEGLWGEPSYGAGRDTALPTRSIIRLTAINRPQGILDGVLLGAGIGVTSGAIVGLAAEDGWFPAEARAVMGGIVFGVLGIGVGLVVGVLVGARDVYEIAGE